MAKKLGKKARKFARKHLQTAAKRNRKIRNQFNNRRPRRGGSSREEGRPGAGGEDEPLRTEDANMEITDATLVNGLEFPEDEADIDTELSDSDDYLPEDPECPYYSGSEDDKDKDYADHFMQDGLDNQNAEMNLDLIKQKKTLEKLLDKDPEFGNFLDKWKSELQSYKSKEVSESDEDAMDSMDDDDDSGDRNLPNDKILTSKTISEWCQLVAKEPKSPALQLYSLDVQNSFEKVVTSVGHLNAILRLASKTKEKVPKSLLKSRNFQEECILSAIQVLSAHFAQWSYHVSFPEVATIPLILLKRLHEETALESLRRPIKRLIDQVNENKSFIQRKREEVSFSPKDKASVESFLQEEKNTGNASFTRYYGSISEERQLRGRKAH
ncbi:hypothetical protein PR202_ga00069 [Eleusine coracana subsp. coracana]|uniref:Uncharacterized protein n=1 Tax=Eleusine coracana subsp. coracana TaxID=191504 RepID=A0AAV5BAY3_ELECO|nr:hypothetical protein PR202_ga00069 [Eleusine coracana subsp. coracana]